MRRRMEKKYPSLIKFSQTTQNSVIEKITKVSAVSAAGSTAT